jgi:hypothetical protein
MNKVYVTLIMCIVYYQRQWCGVGAQKIEKG